MELQALLEDLNVATATQLWKLGQKDRSSPKLIFPVKRNNDARISEQEARILYCQELEKGSWFYSVETPTEQKFSFSGRSELSARSDVSIYATPSPVSKLANVEFKANNPVPESFQKDLEKLVRETPPGVWFHLLKDYDSDTLESIFCKFYKAFNELNDEHLKGPKKNLSFAFCILDPPELFQASILVGDSKDQSLKCAALLFGENGRLASFEAPRWRRTPPAPAP